MLEDKDTFVKAYAFYWNAIYSYVTQLLEKNEDLAAKTMIVKFEDLTDNSAETIDKILAHLELDRDKAAEMRAHYIEKLHKPKYYKPSFTEEELKIIKEETHDTAKLFGYYAD